jgi:hypothetical protein
VSTTETTGSPRFLGNPPPTCPALRPRWASVPSHSALRYRLPRSRRRRLPSSAWVSHDWHFGAPSHGLHARCLRFAARVTPAPRKTRSRLVASLGRTGLVPARFPSKGFRILFLLLHSPFPGFAWRTVRSPEWWTRRLRRGQSPSEARDRRAKRGARRGPTLAPATAGSRRPGARPTAQ